MRRLYSDLTYITTMQPTTEQLVSHVNIYLQANTSDLKKAHLITWLNKKLGVEFDKKRRSFIGRLMKDFLNFGERFCYSDSGEEELVVDTEVPEFEDELPEKPALNPTSQAPIKSCRPIDKSLPVEKPALKKQCLESGDREIKTVVRKRKLEPNIQEFEDEPVKKQVKRKESATKGSETKVSAKEPGTNAKDKTPTNTSTAKEKAKKKTPSKIDKIRKELMKTSIRSATQSKFAQSSAKSIFTPPDYEKAQERFMKKMLRK